jgi:hypothetical protein
MKVIYMAETLNLLAHLNGIESVNSLVATGEIKQTETLTYLTIQINE